MSQHTIFRGGCALLSVAGAALSYNASHSGHDKAAKASMVNFVQGGGLEKQFACPLGVNKDAFIKSIESGTNELTYPCPDGVRDLTLVAKSPSIVTTVKQSGQRFSTSVPFKVTPADINIKELKIYTASLLEKAAKAIR